MSEPTTSLPLAFTSAGSRLASAPALLELEGGDFTVESSLEPLQAVASEIEAMQIRSLAVPTDVGDPDSVASLFAQTKEKFGRLDVLFNNAGFGAAGLLEDLPFDKWMGVIGSIVNGTFLCTQQAFRMMARQTPRGGRIINNGSISAHVPRPHSAPYTAAKHGLTGLTRSTSLDGRAHDIACGQIDIGNAETELTKRFGQGVLQANGSLMAEPVFDARHVADAVLYMASLPLDANVQFLTITATTMPFIGRG